MMGAYGRRANFQRVNQDTAHQRMAGIASYLSFSAHWRAWQGLPLLHPADVIYLTPADFHGRCGQPLTPARQRRLFREYVAAAANVPLSPLRSAALASTGRGVPVSAPYRGGDLAFVRMANLWARPGPRRDVVYGGRHDIGRFESEALLPTRPYMVPVASQTFPAYWCDVAPDPEQDDDFGDW